MISRNDQRLLGGRLGIGMFCLAAMFISATWQGMRSASAQDAAPGGKDAGIDLREKFNDLARPVRPQGSRGTCSVFTVVGAIEFALARHQGRFVPLSVEYLNWASNDAADDGQDGSYFHDALNGFFLHNLCAEAAMPYRAKFDAAVVPSARVQSQARQLCESLHRVMRVNWIRRLSTDAGLKDEHMARLDAALREGWPIAMGSAHSVLLIGWQEDPIHPGGGAYLARDTAAVAVTHLSRDFVRDNACDVFYIDLVAPIRSKRSRWRYQTGDFIRSGRTWLEQCDNGTSYSFVEKKTTAGCIGIYDPERNLELRFYGLATADLYWQPDVQGPWRLLYTGSWQD